MMTVNNTITLPGLADARERQGLNQSQLATRVGVHRATICRFEKGRVTTRPTAYRIALALGVPLDALVTVEAEDGPQSVQSAERGALSGMRELVAGA